MIGDPLAKSVLNNLALLEGLARCLDREYRGGIVKCWRHLAEHFEIEVNIYEGFTSCQEKSPTEDLFEFLKVQMSAKFTIRKLKEKLSSINRQDVIQDVLLKYQELGE